MKKKAFIIVVLLSVCSLAFADNIILTTPETLSTPTAYKIADWRITNIDATSKTLQVQYRWEDSDGNIIRLNTRNATNIWICRDIADDPETVAAECIGAGDPWSCCTGAGTGNCDESDPCFTDIFGFLIRQQDVNTKIGVGLRTLIWNKMKADILTGGNTGTFDTN